MAPRITAIAQPDGAMPPARTELKEANPTSVEPCWLVMPALRPKPMSCPPLVRQEPTPERFGALPDISQPHSLRIVGNDLVFLDGFTVHVRSPVPFGRKRSCAGQGDVADRIGALRARPLAEHCEVTEKPIGVMHEPRSLYGLPGLALRPS